jgi:hypothetical protein
VNTIFRKILILILLLIDSSLVFAGTDNKSGSNPCDFTNVILVGWDGTDRDILTGLLQAGKLPNLKMIALTGSFIKTEITTGKTQTKPGWAEILTGYSSKTVGVINNRVNYQPIPKGYTIFERLKKAFKKDGIATIFLAGKRPNLGARGPHRVWASGPREYWDREDVWGKLKPPPPANEIISYAGEPYFLTKASLDVYQNGLGISDVVVKKTVENIRKFNKSRFFLFCHFGEPDDIGHLFKGGSAEYIHSIEHNDLCLGMIISALKDCGIYEKTLIYVTTDHGFKKNGSTHYYEPHTFLATNDPKVTRDTGDRKDITPTILSRYGIDLAAITPALEGASLNDQ